MHKASLKDFILLIVLAAIWGSAFFNIKIASDTYTPMAIAFGRIFFAALVMVLYCGMKGIKIDAFGEHWKMYASIGLVNLILPFFFISFGIVKVQSNMAAILMSTAPIYATILGQLFIQDEKINFLKLLGIIIGFLGIVFLFSDDLLINQSNFLYALIIILGPFCYTLGGLLSLKLKHIKNETLTSSILVWAVIMLLPVLFIVENPTELRPSWSSTISLFYLGVVATAIAWLMRFYILKSNGLVFQSQVAYIIPIFGLIFGYVFLGEKITYKIIVALIAVLVSTYLIEKSKKAKTP
ncbi:MAG: DMT family transporter [Alphaproteobacteria bacterium]|jgi:drug/metabolite transporter (DMT)-like permease|nr:DMT family transporter [Alphaproteobacteria bacterium]